MCFRCICFASAALTPAGNMFGGGGGGGRPKPRKTRTQYRRELVEFYKRYAKPSPSPSPLTSHLSPSPVPSPSPLTLTTHHSPLTTHHLTFTLTLTRYAMDDKLDGVDAALDKW